MKKIEKLGQYISEYSVRNKANEDIQVYSVTNTNGFCTEYFDKEVASKDQTNYKIVPKGYFAYNPSRINVGSIDCQTVEDRVIVSPLYVVFKADERVDNDYLLHYLTSDIGKKYINELASGSVRANLKFSILQDFPFPMVPIEEQKEKMRVIAKIDENISYCDAIIEKLDVAVKSRFIEMFGDPVLNDLGWKKETLGQRCEIITGNTPPREEAENYGTYIEWIKSDNINTPYTYLTKAEEYLSEEGFKKCRYVDAGSVLMTCIAGSISCIGNVGIANRRVSFNQQINAIVPDKDEPIFIYWLMLLSKPYIHSSISKALKGILSKGKLSEMEFIFPPVELQHEFARYVEAIDKSKLAVQEIKNKMEILKASVMQEYFC